CCLLIFKLVMFGSRSTPSVPTARRSHIAIFFAQTRRMQEMKRAMNQPLRRVISVAAAAGALVFVAGCSGGGSTDATSVTFVGWGGSEQEAISDLQLKPFEEEIGITVVEDNPLEWHKIQWMAETGKVTWDVVQYGPLPGGLDSNPALEDIDC